MSARRPLAHRRAAPAGRAGPPRSERGSVLALVAVCMGALVVCTALTVDLGRVATARRDLQNVADALALDLVRLVDGRPAGEVLADPRWDATLAAARQRNDFGPGDDRQVDVLLGTHDAPTGAFVAATGAEVPSAVQVRVRDRVGYLLVSGGATPRTRAVAAQRAAAGVAVGSFAARLDGERGALLDALVGDALGVDLVSYRGLAGASIRLGDLLGELGLSVGTPEELASATVPLGDLLAAQAELLRRGGDLSRATLLEQVVVALPRPDRLVALADVLLVGVGGDVAAEVALDVLELVTASALVADGGRFLDVPDLGLSVAGGAVSQSARVSVIHRPSVAVGPVGTTARTAQVRVEVRLQVVVPGLATTTVDVAVDVAPSEATVAAVGCSDPRTARFDVRTGLAEARVDVAARLEAVLLVLPVVVAELEASARAERPAGVAVLDLTFPPDVVGEPIEVVAGGLGLGAVAVSVDRLRLLGGVSLGVAQGLAGWVLSEVVGPLLGQVEALVLEPLLDVVGARLGGADVTPLAVSCADRRLVA